MRASIDDLAGEDGTIVGVAVDHRDAFHAALAAAGIAGSDEELVGAIKLDVCEALGPLASMLLVDDATLARARREGRALDAAVALPLEAQGSGALHEVERTPLLAGDPARAAAEAGAVACKLLLPFRPDHPGRATAQLDVARAAITSSRAAGLPLILEPIVWSAPGEGLGSRRLAELVVESATRLAPLEPGLLKLQYPGAADACARLHDACAGQPWVLLGGGAPLDALEAQVAEACDAGALGCIVGRSLFLGALDAEPTRRRAWLREVAAPALERLAAAASRGRASGGSGRIAT